MGRGKRPSDSTKKPCESLRLQISKASALLDIGPKFSEAVSTNHLLSMIVKETLDLMDAEVCIIWLKDKDSNLVARISFGLKGAGIQSTRISVSERLMKCIINKKDPTYIANLSEDSRVPLKKIIKKEGLKSMLAAPLTVGDENMGVLMICTKSQGRRFHATDFKIFNAIARQAALATANIGLYDRVDKKAKDKINKMSERMRKDYLNTIKTLARIIDENDPYTRGHCQKVMRYSTMICKKMKLPERHRKAIKTASLLHDIGKIGIDMGILRKVEKLSDDDWKKIRLHPEIGARIVSQVGFLNDVVPIIKYHHSRYNGGGYPDPNRKEGNIPIGSRIITVADAYDAMTSDRPYRKAMQKDDALMELKKCSGEQFDPEVVGAFLNTKLR